MARTLNHESQGNVFSVRMTSSQRTNQITFDDFEAPSQIKGQGNTQDPDVPLVVAMHIAGFEMSKILIDTGSSANIIFLWTLKNMNLKPDGMRDVMT